MSKQTLLILALAALVAAVPAFGAADVIPAGPDLWKTIDDGSTRASFAHEPIPAGFFCRGSAPFTGNIGFRGVPVTTEPAGVLGQTDTVVMRLDDARFDATGKAETRVQVQAMEFVSLEPVKNDCGTFDVKTVLEGEQPITRMEILRTGPTGGFFLAPISVRVRLVFVPRESPKRQVSLVRALDFAPVPNASWLDKAGNGFDHPGTFRIDTDADRVADTWVDGTTHNFAAGWGSEGGQPITADGCHCDYVECGHRHCLTYGPYDDVPTMEP